MNISWPKVGSSFLSWAFAFALALLSVLLLRSIAVQITPPPAPVDEARPNVSTPEACEEAGGTWQETPVGEEGARTAPAPVAQKTVYQGYCEGPLEVDRERTKQEEASRQTSLFVFAVGGTLYIVASLLAHTARGVSGGLMLGGIASFFVAGTNLWLLAPGLGRVITLAILFLILIGVGWKFFEGREKK